MNDTNLVYGPLGVAKIISWPSLHRKIFARPAPTAGGGKTTIVQLRGNDPLSRTQIIHMAGGDQ